MITELMPSNCFADIQTAMYPYRDKPEPKTTLAVLVVDDEAPIVDLVDTIMRNRGHRCTGCTDGQSALALMEKKDFDLLICDYHMPGTGGRELMEAVHASGKNTRVLVLSGDVANGDARNQVNQLDAHFLPKPFRISDLLTAIDQVLCS